MIKSFFGAAIALVASVVSSLAIPASLSVDLRSKAWALDNGRPSYTVNNVTATGSTLDWNSKEGVGISDSEGELHLQFSLGSGNGLTGVWVTNLFFKPGIVPQGGVLILDTTVGDEKFFILGAKTAAQDPLGDVFVSFNGTYDVLEASFYRQIGSYDVAGFSRVPETGPTLALLAIGLLSLCVLGGKKLSWVG
jgi:hypothetical protein